MLRAAQITGAAVAAHQCLPSGIRDPERPASAVVDEGFSNPWRTGGRDGICRFNSKRRIWRRRRSNRLFVWNRHLRPHPSHPQPRPQVIDFRIERRGRRGWDDEDVADLMKAMGDRVADGAKFGRVEL